MPITSTCPHCQKSVRFTEQNAGLQLRCPYCQQTFRADPLPPPEVSAGVLNLEIPAESPRFQSGAVPISSENSPLPFMDFRGVIPPESPDGELPEPARDPGRPPPISRPPAPGTADERWWHVSQGLLLVLGAQVMFIIANLVLVGFYFVDSDKGRNVARVAVVAFLLFGLSVHVWGMLTCLRVPPQARVSGLMHAAVWPSVAGAVLALLGTSFFATYLLDDSSNMRPSPVIALAAGLGTLLQLFAGLALAIGNIFFLICLRGIARFYGKPRLAQHFLVFLIAAPVIAILFVLVSVLAVAVLRSVLRDGEVFWSVWYLLWHGVRLTLHLALVAWGVVLIQQLRATMDHAVEAGALETP